MARPLLIDTDIGTDVDDLMVLAMLPNSPEVEPALVTTAYGDVFLRAEIVALALQEIGLACRVSAGCSTPLSGAPVFWPGHEGEGFPGLRRRSPALGVDGSGVNDMIAESHRHDGQLEILAIAPLTNLATCLRRDPTMSERVRHVFVMGGDFGAALDGAEHNFGCDVVAAQEVAASGLPLTFCGFDSTSRIMFRADECDRIENGRSAGRLVAAQMRRFWQFIDEWAPPEHQGGNMPHDPLALMTAVEPELFDFQHVHVRVDPTGKTHVEPDAASTTRIVRGFDPQAAAESILERLTAR